LPFRSRDSGTSLPKEALFCCAFLCDKDGKTIHDFGEQRPGSGEPLSARLLVSLIESHNLVDFLETVHTRGIILGKEVRIRYAGSARNLLLHGFQTPAGILVFASLVPITTVPITTRPAPTVATLQPDVTHPGTTEVEENIAYLAEVAHDLRNPISSIISACEYLATFSRENLNPEQLELIAGIESSAASLLQLSRQLSERAGARSESAGHDAATSK
jgi:signal transduction histidine kinase